MPAMSGWTTLDSPRVRAMSKTLTSCAPTSISGATGSPTGAAPSSSRAGTRGGGDRAPRGIQPEQVDDDRHRERCNADAANDQDPGAVVDDGRVPGPLQVASE